MTRRALSAGLLAVCLGYFMIILDTTIVNVALPAIRDDLGTSVSGLQWVVDGYLLTFAALLLSGGAAADRWGARRVFQVGLGTFVLTSAGCALAPGTAVLVGARFAQGVAAALSVPASLAALRARYEEPAGRARAIGVWGGVAGIAAATGPIAGGLLVGAAGWRLVFVVNVPIGLAAMALTARYVRAVPPRPHGLDLTGQLTGMVALGCLTLALIDGGRAGWTPPVVAAAALCPIAAAAFLAAERRARHPLLPLPLLRHRGFTAGNLVGLLINLGFYGQLFVINLYFQQDRHYSPILAGLALLPQMGVVALASALSGRFTARYGGPRPTMLLGLLVAAAGLLGLTAAASAPYPLLVLPLMATGFGMAFTMPAATTAVVDGAPGDRAGLASASVTMSRQIGSTVGIALLGALGASAQRPAFALSAAAFLVAALLAATAIRAPDLARV